MFPRRTPAEPVTPERAAELAAVKAAVAARIGAEFGAAQLARTLSLPAELLVPVVRLATGQSGVALAPAIVGQLDAVVAGLVVRAVRRRGRVRTGEPLTYTQRAALLVGLAVCVLGPLAAAGTSRAVVLPGRSSLWGYLVQGLPSLPVSVAMVTVLLREMRAARDEHRRTTGLG